MADILNIGSLVADLTINSGDMDAKLARARAGLATLERELKALDAALDNGSLGLMEYTARVNDLIAAQNQLAAATKSAYATMGVSANALGVANAAAKNSTNALTGAVRSLGYGLNDVFANNGPLGQKLIGFANNVGGLSSSLLALAGKTGPAAMAAAQGLELAFTVAGAAMSAYGIKTVDDLVRVFSGGVKEIEHSLEGLQAHVAELEKNPARLAVDTQELDAAKAKVDAIKAALAALKEVQGLRGPEAEQASKTVKEAVAEAPGGGEAVTQAVRTRVAHEIEEGHSGLAESRAKQAEAGGRVARIRTDMETRPMSEEERGGAEAALARATKERDAAQEKSRAIRYEIIRPGGSADQETGRLFKEALHGQGDPQRLAREKIAGIVGNPTADVVMGKMPTAKDAKKQADDLDAHNVKEQKAAEAWQKKDKEHARDLTDAGIENERLMRESNEKADAKELADRRRKRVEAAQRDKAAEKQDDELAHHLVPGLDRKAKTLVARGMLANRPMEDVAAELKAELVRRGMGDGQGVVGKETHIVPDKSPERVKFIKTEDGKTKLVKDENAFKLETKDKVGRVGPDAAGDEANRLVREARGKVDEDVARHAEGLHAVPRGNSEVFDTSDLINKLQGANGGGLEDLGKRQVGLLETAVNQLAVIAKLRGFKLEAP